MFLYIEYLQINSITQDLLSMLDIVSTRMKLNRLPRSAKSLRTMDVNGNLSEVI